MVKCENFDDCAVYECKKDHNLETRKEKCEDIDCKEERCDIFYLHPNKYETRTLSCTTSTEVLEAFVAWICDQIRALSVRVVSASNMTEIPRQITLGGDPAEVKWVAEYLHNSFDKIQIVSKPPEYESDVEQLIFNAKHNPENSFFCKTVTNNREMKIFVYCRNQQVAEHLVAKLRNLPITKSIRMPEVIRCLSLKQRNMKEKTELEHIYHERFEETKPNVELLVDKFQLKGKAKDIEDMQQYYDLQFEELLQEQKFDVSRSMSIKEAMFLINNPKVLLSIGEEIGGLISLPDLTKIDVNCCFTRTKARGISIDVLEGDSVFDAPADFYLSTKEQEKKGVVLIEDHPDANTIKRKLRETFDMSALKRAATIAVPLFSDDGDAQKTIFAVLYETSYEYMLSITNCKISRIKFVGNPDICKQFISFIRSVKNERSDIEYPAAVAKYLRGNNKPEVLEYRMAYVIQYFDFIDDAVKIAKKKLDRVLELVPH